MIWLKGTNTMSNGADKIEIKSMEESFTDDKGITYRLWGLFYNGILVERYMSEEEARTMFRGINPTIDDTIFNIIYVDPKIIQ